MFFRISFYHHWGKIEAKDNFSVPILNKCKYKNSANTRACEREGKSCRKGTRVGCVEHEEEAWSIANTLRTLQIQIHSEHYKYKYTQSIANASAHGRKIQTFQTQAKNTSLDEGLSWKENLCPELICPIVLSKTGKWYIMEIGAKDTYRQNKII